jgi:hypothetical protein
MRWKAVAIVFVVAPVLHGATPHAQARVLERLQAGRQRMAARGVQSNQPADAPDVRVLRRELLGRYIEDIDFVPNGPFAHHIVMLNGQEVYGLKANAGPNAPVRKLFDLRQQVLYNPTGIAYVASERLFAVVDSGQPTQLFFMDHRGRPQPARPISYLNGYVPHHIEGLAHVPSSSPRFPDHLLTITWNYFDDPLARVQVIRRDGQVVAEIPLGSPAVYVGEAYGIAFLAPDRLLVSSFFDLFLFDFDGNLLGRFASGNTLDEGIVQLADGRVVTGGADMLFFYDAALNRLPQYDREAATAVGISLPSSVAWNPDRLEHLLEGVEEIAPFDPFGPRVVAALPLSLNAHTTVLRLCCSAEYGFFYPRVAYMPDEHRIAVAGIGFETLTPRIGLFENDGTFVESIDASSIAVGPGFDAIPVEIVYVPATSEFVLVDLYQRKKLKFLTRTGDLAREIDLAPMGIGRISALAYFNPLHPTGGQFLIFDYEGRAVITDFYGNPMREFDYREELGLPYVSGASAITNGPQAGAFTALELASSASFVVFTLE